MFKIFRSIINEYRFKCRVCGDVHKSRKMRKYCERKDNQMIDSYLEKRKNEVKTREEAKKLFLMERL